MSLSTNSGAASTAAATSNTPQQQDTLLTQQQKAFDTLSQNNAGISNSDANSDSQTYLPGESAGDTPATSNGKSSFRRVKSRSARACEVYVIF